ncbi:hypothetical protein [Fodinibius sediminis]|uniref:Uncharacterized protein n=1 Tax=Fodinibius sediminis TaxID=1214077 RepID=A0A521E7G7_9BACT|nr:hypothetical protein [Fodinibius sediminis]SMO79827.1 hypothetical protein SAMN06265218_1141 [Fodinibius sediminis]
MIDSQGLVKDGISITPNAISNSRVNFKKVDYSLNKVIDTLLLSVSVGKEENIDNLLNNKFYDFKVKEVYTKQDYKIYNIKTDRAKIEIKGINSTGFITLKISSLDKLQKDIDKEISHYKESFLSDIKTIIIDEFFEGYVPQYEVYVKQCDLALDIQFPSIKGRDFKVFCRQLTELILNMDFPYLKPEKKDHFNTGYLSSMRTGSKRMRIYNKDLKERARGIGNNYKSTLRIEYIFDSKYQINKYLGGKNLYAIDLEKGFDKINDLCFKTLNKYRKKVNEYYAGDLPQQGERMFQKYAKKTATKNIFNNSWSAEVDMGLLFSGEKPLYLEGSDSSYYKRSNTQKYSYVDYILKNNLKGHFDLLGRIFDSYEDEHKAQA